MSYLDLFIAFIKVGCFSFGGAYSAIPLIQDVVRQYHMMSEDMLTYMIAVSESTPGPIMINLATYVGTHQGGIIGAIIATLSVVLPSFIVILFITIVLKDILKNPYIKAIIQGLKPCIIGIILYSGISMFIKHTYHDDLALIVLLLLVMVKLIYKKVYHSHISPILFIIISSFIGMIVYGI